MPQFKYKKVDEILINAPDLAQAEAELGRQGLVGYVLDEPTATVAEPTKGAMSTEKTVVVTVELIKDSLTVPQMKDILDRAKIQYRKSLKETGLANLILKEGLFGK
jgi:hypothetical protein